MHGIHNDPQLWPGVNYKIINKYTKQYQWLNIDPLKYIFSEI